MSDELKNKIAGDVGTLAKSYPVLIVLFVIIGAMLVFGHFQEERWHAAEMASMKEVGALLRACIQR